MNERSRLYDELLLIPGITVYPSQANFLLVKAANAKILLKSLKSSGILIKGFAISSQLENFVRISVGEAKDNNVLLECIKDFYG
jgi:histidinol-phosphate aminotransferase